MLWPVWPTLPSTYALTKSAGISARPIGICFDVGRKPR